MNRSKLFSALVAASFLTTGAMAQGTPPKTKTVKPAVSAMTVTDTTKKKPMPPKPKHKKVKPAKPDTTKKPN
jgi:hypothetical protein